MKTAIAIATAVFLICGCASNQQKSVTAPLAPLAPAIASPKFVRRPPLPPPDHFTITLSPPHVFTLVKSHDLLTWAAYTNGIGSVQVPNDGAAYFRAIVTNMVQLTWDAPTDSRVTAVKIYQGTASRAYTRATTSTTNVLDLPVDAGTNYFSAVAVAADGSEGAFSPETTWYSEQPTLGIK